MGNESMIYIDLLKNKLRRWLCETFKLSKPHCDIYIRNHVLKIPFLALQDCMIRSCTFYHQLVHFDCSISRFSYHSVDRSLYPFIEFSIWFVHAFSENIWSNLFEILNLGFLHQLINGHIDHTKHLLLIINWKLFIIYKLL